MEARSAKASPCFYAPVASLCSWHTCGAPCHDQPDPCSQAAVHPSSTPPELWPHCSISFLNAPHSCPPRGLCTCYVPGEESSPPFSTKLTPNIVQFSSNITFPGNSVPGQSLPHPVEVWSPVVHSYRPYTSPAKPGRSSRPGERWQGLSDGITKRAFRRKEMMSTPQNTPCVTVSTQKGKILKSLDHLILLH